jgi:hypothetical protein
MFQLKENAARTLKAALDNTEGSQDACFRIGTAEGQLKIGLDEQREGDTTFEHDGQVVLVLDSVTSERLVDRELDVDNATSQLVIR